MIPPQLFVDGTLVRRGERIGKGGEGEVFALADRSGRAIKIYSVADTAARDFHLDLANYSLDQDGFRGRAEGGTSFGLPDCLG